MTEDIGELRMADGTTEKIAALFTVYRDDREVTVCQTDKETIVVSTKSWLRKNDRELVQTTYAYTLDTFTMMLEAMTLGASYLGIDIQKQIALLHASDGSINYEFAGRGEPDFSSPTE